MLLLTDVSEKRIVEYKAQQILQEINKIVFSDGKNVGCFAGIVFFAAHANKFAKLYEVADSALYNSKKNGKNQFTVTEQDS